MIKYILLTVACDVFITGYSCLNMHFLHTFSLFQNHLRDSCWNSNGYKKTLKYVCLNLFLLRNPVYFLRTCKLITSESALRTSHGMKLVMTLSLNSEEGTVDILNGRQSSYSTAADDLEASLQLRNLILSHFWRVFSLPTERVNSIISEALLYSCCNLTSGLSVLVCTGT